MIKKFIISILFGIFCFSISGCLYRGEGIFKKIGDSDYKLRINVLGLAAADGRLTYIGGEVLQINHITPLKNTHVMLKKKGQESVVSNSYTNNAGAFSMSGILQNESYVIEIDSPEYLGSKIIMVEPNRENWHEIFAYKR